MQAFAFDCLRSYFKIGVIVVLLLILVIGPMLQIYDCFNDAPNIDHDALLHTMDALLSIALIFALNWILLQVLGLLYRHDDRGRPLRFPPSIRVIEQLCLSLSPQALPIRI